MKSVTAVKNLWKDSVWSKVIATGLTALIGYVGFGVWSYFRPVGEKVPPVVVDKSRPDIRLRNNVPAQSTFSVMNYWITDRFEWPGLYDVFNFSGEAWAINTINVLWPPNDVDRLQCLNTSNNPMVDVFEDQGELLDFDPKSSKTQKLRSAHLNESLPVIIPSHSIRHLRFHFEVQIFSGKAVQTFLNEAAGYKLLNRALGLTSSKTCTVLTLPVKITDTSGVEWNWTLKTFVPIPGCTMEFPDELFKPKFRDHSKSLGRQDDRHPQLGPDEIALGDVDFSPKKPIAVSNIVTH